MIRTGSPGRGRSGGGGRVRRCGTLVTRRNRLIPRRGSSDRWIRSNAGAASSAPITRGSVTRWSAPAQRMVAPPAAMTLLAQFVASPNGIGMTKPSAVRRTTTGVAYGRPLFRPSWWTTPHRRNQRVPASGRRIGFVTAITRRMGSRRRDGVGSVCGGGHGVPRGCGTVYVVEATSRTTVARIPEDRRTSLTGIRHPLRVRRSRAGSRRPWRRPGRARRSCDRRCSRDARWC